MTTHLAIDAHDPSQVGEARRAAARLAERLGFDADTSGRVALVVTELGTNLVRHAKQGRLLMAARADLPHGGGVELLSLDDGPGMADLAACRRDGYSSAGTPGTGLGAIARMADEFSIHSTPGRGTIVVARVFATRPPRHGGTPRMRVAALSTNAPGETMCGDACAWAIAPSGDQASVLVADGLGHGHGAAEAAQAAVRVFDAAPHVPPTQTLDKAHAALRTTRGAAVAVAQLDASAGRLLYAGAGNICGRILSGVADRSLLSQHGTVGLQIRRVQEMAYDWPAHSLLVMHSDGIATRWTLDDAPGLVQTDPLVIAAWLQREHRRGRDDATVLVMKWG